jgi:hypothetical protein
MARFALQGTSDVNNSHAHNHGKSFFDSPVDCIKTKFNNTAHSIGDFVERQSDKAINWTAGVLVGSEFATETIHTYNEHVDKSASLLYQVCETIRDVGTPVAGCAATVCMLTWQMSERLSRKQLKAFAVGAYMTAQGALFGGEELMHSGFTLDKLFANKEEVAPTPITSKASAAFALKHNQ